MAYTASQLQLTEKDVKTISTVISLYSAGVDKVDRRTLSWKAQRALVLFNVLEQDGTFARQRGLRIFDLFPIESIWPFLVPVIGSGIGQSLAKSKVWAQLNIYPKGHRSHRESDRQEMEELLLELDARGYIYFQCAGSIWEVTPRQNKRPIRDNQ